MFFFCVFIELKDVVLGLAGYNTDFFGCKVLASCVKWSVIETLEMSYFLALKS